MPSRALQQWRSVGLRRLDELERIHQRATGPRPGRRWQTDQLNRSLFVALVAQFQTYCRDLHDEAVEVHVARGNPLQGQLLRTLMTQGRKLDNQTPRTDNLGADFSNLGLKVVEAVKEEGAQGVLDLHRLDALVDFRNGIVHGNEVEMAALVSQGEIRATKGRYGHYRRTLERLAGTMDVVVAAGLATSLSIPLPW